MATDWRPTWQLGKTGQHERIVKTNLSLHLDRLLAGVIELTLVSFRFVFMLGICNYVGCTRGGPPSNQTTCWPTISTRRYYKKSAFFITAVYAPTSAPPLDTWDQQDWIAEVVWCIITLRCLWLILVRRQYLVKDMYLIEGSLLSFHLRSSLTDVGIRHSCCCDERSWLNETYALREGRNQDAPIPFPTPTARPLSL